MEKINTKPVERIYPHDERVKPQTIAHHIARYKFATAFTDDYESENILDMCCGTGYGCEILRQKLHNVVGIDKSSEAIRYAKKHYKCCDFLRFPIQQINTKRKLFNLITFFEALEHFNYQDGITAIQDASKILKPEGYFIISIPRDLNPKYNKYHVSKWSYDMFCGVLKTFFKNVDIFGQDWDTGIINDKKPEKNDFFIAVCSND